jgi:hypothetical protein
MQIRMLTTPDERELAFRHRYEIYVEEMRRRQDYADHEARRIEEPLDRSGMLFGAFSGGRLVGSVRTNFARHGSMDMYDDFYQVRSAGEAYPDGVSITTKLMVDPDERGGAAGAFLAMMVYRHNIEQAITHDFIDCNDHLVPFFEGLGYRRHRPPIDHPEFGVVNPLVLLTHDLEHLVAVRSPFARILRRTMAQKLPMEGAA